MSRTIEQIQASIIADIQAIPELSEANSTSRRAIWRLFTFVQAGAILLLEQIIDVFRAENEILISKAIPATQAWLNKKVLELQYSAVNPQVLTLVDFVPTYPIIDESLRIITRCAVTSTISNQVIIKTAKNDPPEALTFEENNSLQSYVNNIGIVGVRYLCKSTSPDRVYIDADIYYNGQYSTVIASSVESAINTYLANLPFNGQVKVSDLEIAIRSVIGVNDVLINNLKIRENAIVFVDGTFLIQNRTIISRLFPTVSGYVILEDTQTNLFNYIAN